MEYCCEIVENGYMDCKKCYEHKQLDSALYEKCSKGEKLSAEEIKLLKRKVEDY